MPKEEFKKEYPELFKSVPSDILGLFFSEKTPLRISEICLENGVKDSEKISQIAYWIGRVLLGGLSPEKLAEILEKEVKLDQGTTWKIAAEANESFFSPLGKTLSDLYKEESPSPIDPRRDAYDEETKEKSPGSLEEPNGIPTPTESPEETLPTEMPESPAPPEEKPIPPLKEDAYREPIE
jgi:hypothetical protein